MDLFTVGTTAAIAVPTIAAVALYMDRRVLRQRLSVLNGRVGHAEVVYAAQRAKIEKLENQAASDGNRLSELGTENRKLIRERDAARLERDQARCARDFAYNEIIRLQPLADKALATQNQRLAALQKANAANRAAKVKRDAGRVGA